MARPQLDLLNDKALEKLPHNKKDLVNKIITQWLSENVTFEKKGNMIYAIYSGLHIDCESESNESVFKAKYGRFTK